MQQLLSDAIDDFLSLRRTSFGKGTVANNASTMRRFLTVTGNIYVHNIGERHVTRFFEVSGGTRKQASLRNDHQCLSTFFKWARGTKRMGRDHDPLLGRRAPKGAQRERTRLHVSKFPALLDSADDPRDRALLATLLYLLVRDQEAADLRVGDVDLDAGYVTVRIHKSNIEDRMPISAELDKELRRWLTHYTSECGPLASHHYLLPRRRSARITGRDDFGRILGHEFDYLPEQKLGVTGRVVRPHLEKIGFPVTDAKGQPLWEGAHTIRRSGARALFDQACADGYDGALRFVQSVLHHKSITQTEQYIGISADRRSRDERLRGQAMYAIAETNVVRMVQ